MVILITGASGLIGRALVPRLLEQGHTVTRLVRDRPGPSGEFLWSPVAGTIDPSAFRDCDAVVHLAGASIGAGRWTRARKAAIRESRRLGTRLIATGMARVAAAPSVLISASAVGYYGDRGDEWLDEQSAPGTGFLSEVARTWEAETRVAAEAGVRVVLPRFGVVLARHGGALPRLAVPFRFGVGGPIGSGRQWISWISLNDLVRVIGFALANKELLGPINAVAPLPIRQRELAIAIGRALGRPAAVTLPAWVIRLALGQMGEELLLHGQRVTPSALTAAGFLFSHTNIDGVLGTILR